MYYKFFRSQTIWEDSIKPTWSSQTGWVDNPEFRLCEDCDAELNAEKEFKLALMDTLKIMQDSINLLTNKLGDVINKRVEL